MPCVPQICTCQQSHSPFLKEIKITFPPQIYYSTHTHHPLLKHLGFSISEKYVCACFQHIYIFINVNHFLSHQQRFCRSTWQICFPQERVKTVRNKNHNILYKRLYVHTYNVANSSVSLRQKHSQLLPKGRAIQQGLSVGDDPNTVQELPDPKPCQVCATKAELRGWKENKGTHSRAGLLPTYPPSGAMSGEWEGPASHRGKLPLRSLLAPAF